MKTSILKFLAFLALILACVIAIIFVCEKTDPFGCKGQPLAASFVETENGRLRLTWEKLPYPCWYRVETYAKTTGRVEGEPEYHLLTTGTTRENAYDVPTGAIPMYYRVTPYGLFGQLGEASEPVANPIYRDPPQPVVITHYPQSAPASPMPFLVWHGVPAAVCYEVELLSEPPAEEGGTALSKNGHLESTREVFTNGWQADLRKYTKYTQLYWRVRALGLHLDAIGEWSKAEPLVIDWTKEPPDAPLLNDFDDMPGAEMPIYPVYRWIPLHGITHYEVELMTQPPEEEGGTQPATGRVWSRVVDSAANCYDEYARPYAGDYYWRVRALDAKGNTMGHYSKASHFVMPEREHVRAAMFGDSITHGGGAVSYPPSALEYSYGTYLDFPAVNLGRSGDTSKTTLARFEQDVVPMHPENLLILTGTNSLRDPGISADDVIRDLARIKALCEQYGIRPIFLTLMPIHPQNIKFAFHTDTDPKWHAKMDHINAYIKAQPYFIDLEPYFYDKTHTVLDPALSIDGLHPDIQGKQLMGEIINLHQDELQ